MFASGGQDGTVRVWDTRSTKPLFTLHSHAEKGEGEYEPLSGKATKESAADTRPSLAPEGVKVLGLAWNASGGGLWSGGSDAEIHLHSLPGGNIAEL
jgi:WD40 repeat protein